MPCDDGRAGRQLAKSRGASSRAPGEEAVEAAPAAGLTCWRPPTRRARAWSPRKTRWPIQPRHERRSGAGRSRWPLPASPDLRCRQPCSSTRGMAWTNLRLPAPHRWTSSRSRPSRPRRPRCLPRARQSSWRGFGKQRCLLAACWDPGTRRRKGTRGRTPEIRQTPTRTARRGLSWSRRPGEDQLLRRPLPLRVAPCSFPTCAATAGRPLHPNCDQPGG